MGLSCDCSGDYEWFYSVEDGERVACSDGHCYGCCGPVHHGDEVRLLWSYEMDEDGDEENHKVEGRLCPKCCDLYDSLIELGFCLSADRGFVRDAMDEYREYYGKSNG